MNAPDVIWALLPEPLREALRNRYSEGDEPARLVELGLIEPPASRVLHTTDLGEAVRSARILPEHRR